MHGLLGAVAVRWRATGFSRTRAHCRGMGCLGVDGSFDECGFLRVLDSFRHFGPLGVQGLTQMCWVAYRFWHAGCGWVSLQSVARSLLRGSRVIWHTHDQWVSSRLWFDPSGWVARHFWLHSIWAGCFIILTHFEIPGCFLWLVRYDPRGFFRLTAHSIQVGCFDVLMHCGWLGFLRC